MGYVSLAESFHSREKADGPRNARPFPTASLYAGHDFKDEREQSRDAERKEKQKPDAEKAAHKNRASAEEIKNQKGDLMIEAFARVKRDES